MCTSGYRTPSGRLTSTTGCASISHCSSPSPATRRSGVAGTRDSPRRGRSSSRPFRGRACLGDTGPTTNGSRPSIFRSASAPCPSRPFCGGTFVPQPRFGTVEIRIMDAQSRLAETATLVALVQSIARLELEEGYVSEHACASEEVLAENRFLAARDGVDARLIDPAAEVLRPVAEDTPRAARRCSPARCRARLPGRARRDRRPRRGAGSRPSACPALRRGPARTPGRAPRGRVHRIAPVSGRQDGAQLGRDLGSRRRWFCGLERRELWARPTSLA